MSESSFQPAHHKVTSHESHIGRDVRGREVYPRVNLNELHTDEYLPSSAAHPESNGHESGNWLQRTWQKAVTWVKEVFSNALALPKTLWNRLRGKHPHPQKDPELDYPGMPGMYGKIMYETEKSPETNPFFGSGIFGADWEDNHMPHETNWTQKQRYQRNGKDSYLL